MQAYANNLKDSFDQLRTTMQTVEGTRTEDIRKEYAPALAAEASVQMGAAASNKRSSQRKLRPDDPNAPCKIDGHKGHTNKQCNLQKNKGFTYNGKKGLCWHYTKHGNCRYGDKCHFKHSRSTARTYMADHGSSSESSSESDDSSTRRKLRRKKHKRNKRQHKKKRRKKRSRRAHQNSARASRKNSAFEDHMTNNESETSCDDTESDF